MPLAVDLTPVNFFSRAGFHPVWYVFLLLALAWYLGAVHRLRQSGRAWPQYRVTLFVAAMVIVAGATISGLTWWDATNFTVPAIQRVMLAMAAPIPLVMSAPLHLALEAGSPRTRRVVGTVVDSRAARIVAHPLAAFIIYSAALVALYFTPLYRAAVHHDSIGIVVDVALVAVGFLFYTPVFGEDLPPRRVPPVRLVYLLLSMILHTLIGMALESQHSVPLRGLRASDVQTGGGVLWTSGEVIAICGTIAVAVLWFRDEERSAKARDAGDAEEAARQAEAWRAERRLAAAHAAAVRAGLFAEASAEVAAPEVPAETGERGRLDRAN